MKNIIPSILNEITGAVLSKAVSNATYIKIKVRCAGKADTLGNLLFYVEQFTPTQVFHKTITPLELSELLISLTGVQYKQVQIDTVKEIITVLTNKKGKMTVLRKPRNQRQTMAASSDTKSIQKENFVFSEHNRKKNYLIPEGEPVPFLIQLGVMTSQGKIIAAKYDKFRQINRFLEYVEDVLSNLLSENKGTKENPLKIVDFGCGKSYLTFALYHYLTNIKGLEASITGLDLKKEVILMCGSLAKNFGYTGLHFSTGDIESYREKALETQEEPPDLVITLHACDTATDYALAYAVEQKAKVILSVPCCQHEINGKLGKTCNHNAFSPLLSYGIVKERFAALATDVMRAELLESKGYNVQILEFIDMSHTPKNLLIRGIYQGKEKEKSSGYIDLCQALGTNNTLFDLLEKKTIE